MSSVMAAGLVSLTDHPPRVGRLTLLVVQSANTYIRANKL